MSLSSKSAITYFIADLHLAENRPDITACFLAFLANQAKQAQALYILGDLFEYWIGDDDDNPLTAEISAALLTLSKTGTQLFFIQGNRDFLLGHKYAKKSGMVLLPDVQKVRLYDQDFIIMHGDTLCTHDVDYQAFRKKSRTWWWQFMIKSLPLFVRKKIAQNYRDKSAKATAMKSQDIMDVTPGEVINVLEAYQTQVLIHGHTHRPNIHNIEANNQPAQRIVLGDWYEQGSYLTITPEGMEFTNIGFSAT